jgi:pilus assembly protein CpaC
VPALIVRRASTTVELRDGQSFAIGGLLQNNGENQVEQLPWVGSVPVLGALFTSKSYQKKETDLVIIVTPRLVRPARPGEVLRTPADKTVPPNDVDFFALSRNEVARAPKSGTPGQAVATANVPQPLMGHMLDIATR